jgi:hypothetical protein
MERGVRVSIFAVLIIAVAVLTVYYLNLGPTGFAVFQQQTQTDFDGGTYTNTLYNGSAVTLGVNQTSGEYSSKVFDAGSSATWNNLTSQGSSGLAFEVRSCSTANCSDANFAGANLNNLNLSGQYFQYKVSFNSSSGNGTQLLEAVTLDYSVSQTVPAVSVSISEPTGSKSSTSGISLTFTTTGTNLTCKYSVVNSGTGLIVKENTTVTNCANTAFDITSGEGNYTVHVYAEDGSKIASDSSDFSINVVKKPKNTTEAPSTAPITEPIPAVIEQAPELTQASLVQIPGTEINQGDSKEISLSGQNTGTTALSSCVVTGDDSGFFNIIADSKTIGVGETVSFIFLLNVSEEAIPGEYNLGVSLTCAETSASENFGLTVIKKTFNFEIVNVQRTRQDRVRVDYSLTEISGEDQDLEIFFSIKDTSGLEVANISQNSSIGANKTNDFRVNIPINESLEGNLTLSAEINSQNYSSSVLEPITLGAPIGGFAIFAGVGGTGGIVILVIVVLALGVVFLIVKRMRLLKRTQNPIR